MAQNQQQQQQQQEGATRAPSPDLPPGMGEASAADKAAAVLATANEVVREVALTTMMVAGAVALVGVAVAVWSPSTPAPAPLPPAPGGGDAHPIDPAHGAEAMLGS